MVLTVTKRACAMARFTMPSAAIRAPRSSLGVSESTPLMARLASRRQRPVPGWRCRRAARHDIGRRGPTHIAAARVPGRGGSRGEAPRQSRQAPEPAPNELRSEQVRWPPRRASKDRWLRHVPGLPPGARCRGHALLLAVVPGRAPRRRAGGPREIRRGAVAPGGARPPGKHAGVAGTAGDQLLAARQEVLNGLGEPALRAP
jgi:hypothetical protein